MYARGILFGKMKYELGDHAEVKCPESGLSVSIDFKVKGWVGGSYNAIGGYITDKNGKQLFELSGFWNGEMTIKDLKTGKKEVLFDATNAKATYPKTRPLEEQGPRESQKLWKSTTEAIKRADQKVATDEKSRIEDEQRKETAERGEQAWKPQLFRPAPSGDEQSLDWVIDAKVDDKAPAEKQIEQICAIAPVLPGQTWGSQSSQKNDQSSQQPQPTKQQPPPAQNNGGDDLIDFGQNETTQQSSSTIQKQQSQVQQVPQGLQQPLMPSKSKPGNPLTRLDSIGNEEMFMDAET